jgi:hypothetical protein
MSPKKSNLAGAVAGLPKKAPHEAESVVPEEKTSVRQTLYLPKAVHDQIREAAHANRVSQQEIFRQALDLWFSREGLASWEELTGKV